MDSNYSVTLKTDAVGPDTSHHAMPLAVNSAVSWPVPMSQLSDQVTSLIFCSDLDPCSRAEPRSSPCFPHHLHLPSPPVPSTAFPAHGYPNSGIIPKLPRIHTMPLRGLLKSDAPILHLLASMVPFSSAGEPANGSLGSQQNSKWLSLTLWFQLEEH